MKYFHKEATVTSAMVYGHTKSYMVPSSIILHWYLVLDWYCHVDFLVYLINCF